ncbi:hypothetical protein [Derxia gummosa]|uniref:Uncharacterized protein n=1 Tax=Derxia gummosa DSM 723 TaxID=1121388 RepID=A0A8B6XB43_9BURK|nr:hypothetical protein [Derxia gummosa]
MQSPSEFRHSRSSTGKGSFGCLFHLRFACLFGATDCKRHALQKGKKNPANRLTIAGFRFAAI